MPGRGQNAAFQAQRKKHLDRLERLAGTSMQREVGKAVFAAGEMVQVEAQLSITAGSVSGKGHVPSLPGQPPSNDTGVLSGNIETELTFSTDRNPEAKVSSNAPYSTALEFGTSKMEARPFLAPARDKVKPDADRLLIRAVRKVMRGGTL